MLVFVLLWYGVVECAVNGLYVSIDVWGGARVVFSGMQPGWGGIVWACVVSEGP